MPFFIQTHFVQFSSLLLGLILSAYGCGGNADSPTSTGTKENSLPPKATVDIKKGEFSTGDRRYPTFQMNNLTWLGSNLDLAVPDSWCYDDRDDCEGQGRLYRWARAKVACATLGEGWRLPTELEWQQLANTLGGYTDWLSEQDYGDPVAANRAILPEGSSGFDAPLSGWRGSNGGFDSAGQMGFYWTATETTEDEAWFYIVLPAGGKLTRRSTNKRMGMACRCVRNVES